jgi:peptidoglycan/xylan/chitin deacetylase (PgdA/CDA1 family)
VNGFVTSSDFYEYLVDTFEQLHAEGGRMMSVGLHCRIVGRPGRAPALDRFLAYVRKREDVWVTTRAEIARHWHAHRRAEPLG